MKVSRAWLRRFAIATAVAAGPAFAFLTFDALIAGGDATVDRPALVETLGRVRKPVSTVIRAAGERLRGADAEPSRPPSPFPTLPPRPEPPAEVRIPILVYHNIRAKEAAERPADRPYDVTPAELDAQLAHLASEGFVSVAFDDLASAFEGTAALPARPVIITFDDGRRDQYENAYPLLVRHGFTATFFVFTNAIGRDGYLTWDQLEALRDAGMGIGSHAVYHPYLTRIDDAALASELRDSRSVLEKGLGAPVTAFAYPFGLYDERVIAAVRAAGYSTARGLAHDATVGKDDVLTLPGRIVTGDLRTFKTMLAPQVR